MATLSETGSNSFKMMLAGTVEAGFFWPATVVARGRHGATQQRLERPRPAKPVAQRGPAGRCDDQLPCNIRLGMMSVRTIQKIHQFTEYEHI